MPADTKPIQSLLDQIHWLSAELRRRAAAASEQEKLLLAARNVLQTLAEAGELSVPAIATARNTTRQNIQIIANRLAEHGLIEFAPNPRHKKSDLLRLTEKGSALLASAIAQEAGLLDHLATHLRKSEVDGAASCLAHLRSALGSPSSPINVEAAVQVHRPAVRGGGRALPVDHTSVSRPAANTPEPAPVQITSHFPKEEDSLPVNLL